MRDKGRLRPGADADITVFDPITVRDASTYTQAALQPLGMRYVLVNGTVVVRDGKVQAGRGGKGNPRAYRLEPVLRSNASERRYGS